MLRNNAGAYFAAAAAEKRWPCGGNGGGGCGGGDRARGAVRTAMASAAPPPLPLPLPLHAAGGSMKPGKGAASKLARTEQKREKAWLLQQHFAPASPLKIFR